MTHTIKEYRRKDDYVRIVRQQQFTKSRLSKNVIQSHIGNVIGYYEYSETMLDILLHLMYKNDA